MSLYENKKLFYCIYKQKQKQQKKNIYNNILFEIFYFIYLYEYLLLYFTTSININIFIFNFFLLDSIVRGTTSREIIQMARDAGAKKVYFASCSPPIRYPNVYGIDMPTSNELIAYNRTEEEIAKELGADCVIYEVNKTKYIY